MMIVSMRIPENRLAFDIYVEITHKDLALLNIVPENFRNLCKTEDYKLLGAIASIAERLTKEAPNE